MKVDYHLDEHGERPQRPYKFGLYDERRQWPVQASHLAQSLAQDSDLAAFDVDSWLTS